jgi:excisionase family DNA binding protein
MAWIGECASLPLGSDSGHASDTLPLRESTYPLSGPVSLPDVWPPVFLTVTEAARKLSWSRSTILRQIHNGELCSLRLGRTYRIPEAEVRRLIAYKSRDCTYLTAEECARILRCSPNTIYGLLHHGHLSGETGRDSGQYLITGTEFRRFLASTTSREP